MWSPYHFLYVIRKDKLYSSSIKIKELKAILNSTEGIVSTGNLTYRNKAGYPSISILIVDSIIGNFAIKDEATTFDEINLIEIETSKKKVYKNYYLRLMIGLASKLNWELVLSEEEETLIWDEGKTDN